MAKSPYDNLPVNNYDRASDPDTSNSPVAVSHHRQPEANIDTPAVKPSKIDVQAQLEQDTQDTASATRNLNQSNSHEEETSQSQYMEYVDVEIEEADPEELEMTETVTAESETAIANTSGPETPGSNNSASEDAKSQTAGSNSPASEDAKSQTAGSNSSASEDAKPQTTMPESAISGTTASDSNMKKNIEKGHEWKPLNQQTRSEERLSSQRGIVQPKSAAPLSQAKQQNPHNTLTHSIGKTVPLQKQPQYSKLSIKNKCSTDQYTLPFEESLLVPDTMPDMTEILFAEGSVSTLQPSENKYKPGDFVSGDITFYTVYRPDTADPSPVDVIKSVIPFKTDKCWPASADATFRAVISIKNISAEKINERKFIAKGELLISVTTIAQQELTTFKEPEDSELICLHSDLKATVLDFETEEITEISQEINIKDDQPTPTKILKESIHIVENHKQITSGKLVINAVIHSNILYLGEHENGTKLCCLNNKTDFTQFIPVKDDTNVDLIKIDYISSDLKMTIEGSSEFCLQGQVKTLIHSYTNKTLPMVSDAYHKNCDVQFNISQQSLAVVEGTVSGEISAREVVNIDDTHQKPAELVCGTCRLTEVTGTAEGGRVIIGGNAPVSILALDENDVPFVIKAQVPLRGSLEMPSSRASSDINVDAVIKEFWFNEINSRQIEVNVSAAIEVWICGTNAFTTLEDLRICDTDPCDARASLAVYVTGKGDTLWDIAKRYRSDAAAIAELNELDPQRPPAEGTKLLIMK